MNDQTVIAAYLLNFLYRCFFFRLSLVLASLLGCSRWISTFLCCVLLLSTNRISRKAKKQKTAQQPTPIHPTNRNNPPSTLHNRINQIMFLVDWWYSALASLGTLNVECWMLMLMLMLVVWNQCDPFGMNRIESNPWCIHHHQCDRFEARSGPLLSVWSNSEETNLDWMIGIVKVRLDWPSFKWLHTLTHTHTGHVQ